MQFLLASDTSTSFIDGQGELLLLCFFFSQSANNAIQDSTVVGIAGWLLFGDVLRCLVGDVLHDVLWDCFGDKLACCLLLGDVLRCLFGDVLCDVLQDCFGDKLLCLCGDTRARSHLMLPPCSVGLGLGLGA